MTKFNYFQETKTNVPNILFIHGFGASKAFINKLRKIPHQYNIISLSLPNSQSENNGDDASISQFGEYVKQFLQTLKLTKVTIFGHSLGGAVISFLHDVKIIDKFILCTPLHPYAGFQKAVSHWLLPKNFEESLAGVKALVYDLKVWKGQEQLMANAYLKKIKQTFPFWEKMVNEEILDQSYLKTTIYQNYEKLKAKAIIIGCVQDNYINYQLLKKTADEMQIPFKTINNCGHVPVFEKSHQINEIITKVLT